MYSLWIRASAKLLKCKFNARTDCPITKGYSYVITFLKSKNVCSNPKISPLKQLKGNLEMLPTTTEVEVYHLAGRLNGAVGEQCHHI
jgi:hypothetical protein